MATYSKQKLSSCTDGRGIKVAAVATAGTAVHTAHATDLDEIWLYAYNSDTSDRKLTIEFGGVTAPDDNIVIFIPPSAGVLTVVPGLILSNSTAVKAFCDVANKVVVFGYVNRITA